MCITNRRLGVLVCLGAFAGCAAPPASSTHGQDLGIMTLNLVGQAPSGAVYRLRDAAIEVDGPAGSRIWNTEDDPARTTLSADVVPGDYTASVHDGWRLERIEGSTALPVTGALASENPVHFAVAAGQRTSVPLRFVVDGDDVDLTQGYDITITVEEAPRRLVVSQFGAQAIPAAIEVFSRSASGDTAPLRQIAGPHTELSSPASITAVGNEILVCDQGSHALLFFTVNAHGDVTPARRIAGPSTGLGSPTSAVVFRGEIYTLQVDGRVLVFPVGASGDVAPTRALQTPGAQFLAVDHDEIYLRTTSDEGLSLPRILVFPITATGTPQPTRTITGLIGDSGACPGTIIARDQELIVTDRCGAIYVFAASASGSVPPLRVITGSATQLDMPWQISLFRGELYVADQASDRVSVFPVQGSGDIAPTRVLQGPATGIAQPLGVAVF